MFKNQIQYLLLSIGLALSPAYADSDSFISSPDAGIETQVSKSQDPTVVREKAVIINSGLINPSADVKARAADASAVAAETAVASSLYIEVDFFGEPILLVLDDSSPIGENIVSWVGHIQGVPRSQVILAVGERGIVQGNIVSGSKKYHIRYVEHIDGQPIHTLQEIDMSEFPPDHPSDAQGGFIFDEPDTVIESQSDNQPDSNDAVSEGDQASVAEGSGSIIDVMILYTADAETRVGGASAMQTKIALAISETNTGYKNSGIAQRMNLVHSQKVTYTETGNTSQDLANLSNRTGYSRAANGSIITTNPASPNPLESVTATSGLRDTYKADLVGFFVSQTNYSHTCGLGNVGPSVDASFQVTNEICATGYYSFAHEFGHNQGALHDRRISGSLGDSKYQYGYVKTDKRWRTIMAYNDSANCATPCSRQNFWSNPEKSFYGDATGIVSTDNAGADNAKWMNEKAYTVANHRQNHTTYPLPANQWHQIGLPYAPPAGQNTVADIIGDDMTGTINADWALYKYDAAAGNYVALSATDTMQQGVGYWIINVNAAVTLDMPEGSTTTPTPVTGVKCPSSSGCFETEVLATAPGTHKWNMISNPFPQNKQFQGIRVDSDFSFCASNSAQSCWFDFAVIARQINDKAFRYNAVTGVYDEITKEDYLSPWAGFWLATQDAADGNSPKLLIPSNEQLNASP